MGLVIYHVIPSIGSSLLYLLIVLLVILLFRIKNTTVRALLFIMVLYKSNEAFLLGGIKHYRGFGPTVRLFDPLDRRMALFGHFHFNKESPFLDIIVLTGIAIFIGFLFFRWFQLWSFYSKLSSENYLNEGDVPKIDRIVKFYLPLFDIKKPKIALSSKNYSFPVVVGFIKPVIVISPKMIDVFDEKYLEIILAHEFAHIKKKDNFFHLVALFFRDLMIFNPFCHVAYKKYLKYKEIAVDNMVIRITDLKNEDVKRCINEVADYYDKHKLKHLSLSSAYYNKVIKARQKWLVKKKQISFFKLKVVGVIPIFILLFLLHIRFLVSI